MCISCSLLKSISIEHYSSCKNQFQLKKFFYIRSSKSNLTTKWFTYNSVLFTFSPSSIFLLCWLDFSLSVQCLCSLLYQWYQTPLINLVNYGWKALQQADLYKLHHLQSYWGNHFQANKRTSSYKLQIYTNCLEKYTVTELCW